MLSRRQVSVLTACLIAVPVAAGVAVWSRLPAEMAIHFSATGTPDNYVPKPVGVFLVPVVMLFTLAVIRAAFRADPPDDSQIEPVVTVSSIALLSAVQLLVLAWNLGYSVPFDLVLVAVVLWSIGLVGYVTVRERGMSVP